MSRSTRALLRAYVSGVSGFLPDHEAAREAGLVVTHLTGLSRARQISDPDLVVDGIGSRFDEILAARTARQPLAQILGHAPFRDRLFEVTPDVLSPRADTEILIDCALEQPFVRLLDLGTGPGTIVLTLLAEQPDAHGVGSDISDKALAVAARNAQSIGVSDRLQLVQSDWFEQIDGRFDLIVSNPPYVDALTYETLVPEITDWEPRIALTPGGDGLAAYRQIAARAGQHLAPDGRLIVEIGHDQGRAVADLFSAADLDTVTVHPDLNGKDRVVSTRAPGGR